MLSLVPARQILTLFVGWFGPDNNPKVSFILWLQNSIINGPSFVTKPIKSYKSDSL